LTDAKIFGAEYTIHTKEYGDITQTAWLPNFQSPYFLGLTLVEEIARLLALEQLRKLKKRVLTSQEFAT
jgi:hypothetical protein